MLRLKHKHEGVGRLELQDSRSLTKVAYNIGEYCDVLSTASFHDPDATIEGLTSFRGTIRAKDGSLLPFVRDAITLHLGDGRRLNVLLTETNGSEATVQGTGGFF